MPKLKKTTKYDNVPDVKLTSKEESYLRKKFEKYAKALEWNIADTKYYIHVGSKIIKHTDTRCLFNILAGEYKKDNNIAIW